MMFASSPCPVEYGVTMRIKKEERRVCLLQLSNPCSTVCGGVIGMAENKKFTGWCIQSVQVAIDSCQEEVPT